MWRNDIALIHRIKIIKIRFVYIKRRVEMDVVRKVVVSVVLLFAMFISLVLSYGIGYSELSCINITILENIRKCATKEFKCMMLTMSGGVLTLIIIFFIVFTTIIVVKDKDETDINEDSLYSSDSSVDEIDAQYE